MSRKGFDKLRKLANNFQKSSKDYTQKLKHSAHQKIQSSTPAWKQFQQRMSNKITQTKDHSADYLQKTKQSLQENLKLQEQRAKELKQRLQTRAAEKKQQFSEQAREKKDQLSERFNQKKERLSIQVKQALQEKVNHIKTTSSNKVENLKEYLSQKKDDVKQSTRIKVKQKVGKIGNYFRKFRKGTSNIGNQEINIKQQISVRNLGLKVLDQAQSLKTQQIAQNTSSQASQQLQSNQRVNNKSSSVQNDSKKTGFSNFIYKMTARITNPFSNLISNPFGRTSTPEPKFSERAKGFFKKYKLMVFVWFICGMFAYGIASEIPRQVRLYLRDQARYARGKKYKRTRDLDEDDQQQDQGYFEARRRVVKGRAQKARSKSEGQDETLGSTSLQQNTFQTDYQTQLDKKIN